MMIELSITPSYGLSLKRYSTLCATPHANLRPLLHMTPRSNRLSDDTTRPKWFTRRNIEPFTIGDAAVEKIINEATHAVVSWVTKDHKPASAVMLYRVIDGVITITSTTNRAKYHAWRRNPSACSVFGSLETLAVRSHCEEPSRSPKMRHCYERLLSLF